MFDCWNDNSYFLAAIVVSLMIALGFQWGFRRAQQKYERWIRQMGEGRPRQTVRRVKV
jgi:hypothetical protein